MVTERISRVALFKPRLSTIANAMDVSSSLLQPRSTGVPFLLARVLLPGFARLPESNSVDFFPVF